MEIQLNPDWGAPFQFASDDAALGDDSVDPHKSKDFCRLDFSKREGAGKPQSSYQKPRYPTN